MLLGIRTVCLCRYIHVHVGSRSDGLLERAKSLQSDADGCSLSRIFPASLYTGHGMNVLFFVSSNCRKHRFEVSDVQRVDILILGSIPKGACSMVEWFIFFSSERCLSQYYSSTIQSTTRYTFSTTHLLDIHAKQVTQPNSSHAPLPLSLNHRPDTLVPGQQ